MRGTLQIWLTVAMAVCVTRIPGQAQPPRHGNHRKRAPLSIPVRDMPVLTPDQVQQQQVFPLRYVPKKGAPPATSGRAMPRLQSGQNPIGPNAPTIAGANFEGMGAGMVGFSAAGVPPDTDGAVGRTQYVQQVNSSFTVFDKVSHTILKGPVATNSLWSTLPSSNPCNSTNNGDGIVLYDHLADRWIISQFANTGANNGPYYECVAISQTADATGQYFLYFFTFQNPSGTTKLFNDYPKIGIWPDAYYFSYNGFSSGKASGTFVGGILCALDRTKMLNGVAGTSLGGAAGPSGTGVPAGQNQICFLVNDSALLPSDLDGATAPPAGSPNYILEWLDTSDLGLWKFHVDFTTPTNSTVNGVHWVSPAGPPASTVGLTATSIPVTPFTPTCNSGVTGSTVCIPQGSSAQQVDSLSDRVMFRLAYRNFGGHESLVVNHSVATSGTSGSGVRWYELRNLQGNPPTVFQSGTWAGPGVSGDGNRRWMGSVAMDKFGNLAVGYSLSSGSLNPEVAYAARLAGDPAGALGDEVVLVSGGGSEPTGPGNGRWGDYSALTVDPQDDCTFWYTNEYYGASPIDVFHWQTRIGSFSLAQCQTTPAGVSVTPDTGAGSAQTFSFLYSDTGGASQIATAQGLINSGNSLTNACAFQYNRAANTVQIYQDSGTLNPATLTPGSGSLSNSQCTINGAGTSAGTAGNSLVVNLSVTFTTPGFDGTKTIYMSVTDTGGTTIPFQPFGTWNVQ